MTSHALDLPPARSVSRASAQLVALIAGAALLALAILGVDRLLAQIEGERGIAPVATSTDIHVTGVEVDTTGETGVEAREKGWDEAKAKAWARIGGPKMSDGQLDSMVLAIVIEEEKAGPRRYVARLGVIFDRSKAVGYVGSGGGAIARQHSAPMLVIPVLYSGGVRQAFEVQGPWQRAWATFQAAGSPVNYVRPTGAGGESLILNAGQTGRRSRIWWRTVLNQFEAADVLMPVARLERQWPGGPVKGRFTARYGPDNRYLQTFEKTAKSEREVPLMLAEAVVQMDRLYRDALGRGLLRPDPTLNAGEAAFDAALAQLRAKLLGEQRAEAASEEPTERASSGDTPGATDQPAPSVATTSTFTVQFASPDAAAVDAALSAVRGAAGVSSAATTSLAIGGTSVMRVTFAGDAAALASAISARGWSASASGNTITMSR